MKVLIADKFPDRRRAQLEQAGFDVTYEPGWTHVDLPAKIAGFQAMVVRSTRVQADTLEAADALKLVLRAGSGTNTIDKDAAAAKQIAVCNTPGKNAVAVAELAMGLLLALDRRLPDNVLDLRQGIWNKAEYSRADGIKGKTLGLIGIGAIGREVARRAQAFDMTVIASDPFVTEAQGLELGVEMLDQDTLLERAHVVSLHAPALPETRGMVNADFLGKLKARAILINCARANLIDHHALVAAIKDKGLRYGCDLPPEEPKDKSGVYQHGMFDMPGVYGTHHIGASTNQAQDAVAEAVLDVLNAYRKDGTFLNRVNTF